jgi:hypothetical protein
MSERLHTIKPESEKFTHDEVGYENPSTHGNDCDECTHFIPATKDSPAGCEGVQRPIAEGAWCHRFKKDIMKKHPFSHTVVEHHKDGSHTVHHIHEKHGHVHEVPHRDGDVRGAAGDHDGMIDHVMDHTSAPNVGEGQGADNEAMEEKIAPGIHSAVAAAGAPQGA